MVKALYQTFLEERRYLKNCAPKTLRSYQQAWNAFSDWLNPITDGQDFRVALKTAVLRKMDPRTLKPASINVYLRAMNAFVHWANSEGHFHTPIKGVTLLKTPTKLIPTLNEVQIRQLIQFRPTTRNLQRVHAMSMVVLDCGLRLNECLHLEVGDVDLNNFLLLVQKAKGDRQRRVPISGQGRKVLYRYIRDGGDPARCFVFATANGTPLQTRNADRDLRIMSQRLRIKLNWHLLRHSFGTLFIRAGGNVADLQRILGHSSVTTTMLYVHNQASDFVPAHNALSPLARAAR